MRSSARRAPLLADLPSPPRSVLSFDGQLVDTSGEIWRLRSSMDGRKRIDLDWALQEKAHVLSPRAQHLLKLYFADRNTRKKARTIENDFRMFLRLQKWLYQRNQPLAEWVGLTEGIARAFLQHGVEHTADKGNDFSRLRTFYRWGVARQYEDFDPGFLDILRSITAVGNAKGHSVRFRDVLRGPFTSDELLLVGRAVLEERGTSQNRAIVMLHMELGHNPDASLRLRNSDLVRYETSSAVAWQLDVPRVKKRIPRRETKRRPISTALGILLESLQHGRLGRENARDTEAYRHATESERLEWVKAGMREGTLGGVKAAVYLELPHLQREDFLEGEVQAVHFTAFGICLHDFAVTPCPFHLNCVRSCPDYLRTRGNQKERQHLIQIRTATEQALDAARLQTVRGADIAEPWIRHCEETLDGIAKALAIDDEIEPCNDTALLPRSIRCPALRA